MASPPESHIKAVEEIENLFAELSKSRKDYDFQPPALASHAHAYADQPERLHLYARQVISGRIMILFASSRMNTQILLHSYLLGKDAINPFSILLAARSQLELLSVVADTARVIRENAGTHADNYAARVHKVDEALIMATFGTKHPQLKSFMSKAGLSRLRATTSADLDLLSAKNVLTRLEKISKTGGFPNCMEDYERLCEYVHPNFGMNMLHVIASPLGEKLLRFSLTSREPFERALLVSAPIMARAARGTVRAMEELQPPFGLGTVTRLRR